MTASSRVAMLHLGSFGQIMSGVSVMTQQRGGKGGRYDLRELRDAAIEALLDIVTEPITADSDRSARGTKVAAASRLLSHTEWAEERAPELQFLKLFPNEKAAARYLIENHARLLTLVGEPASIDATVAEDDGSQTEKNADG
jgi:hypothetical protein